MDTEESIKRGASNKLLRTMALIDDLELSGEWDLAPGPT